MDYLKGSDVTLNCPSSTQTGASAAYDSRGTSEALMFYQLVACAPFCVTARVVRLLAGFIYRVR